MENLRYALIPPTAIACHSPPPADERYSKNPGCKIGHLMQGVDGQFWDVIHLSFPGLAFLGNGQGEPRLTAFTKNAWIILPGPLHGICNDSVEPSAAFVGLFDCPSAHDTVKQWMTPYI